MAFYAVVPLRVLIDVRHATAFSLIADVRLIPNRVLVFFLPLLISLWTTSHSGKEEAEA
jgi:hypothetical protein